MASRTERWLSHFFLHLHVNRKPHEGLPLGQAVEMLSKQNVVGKPDCKLVGERWIVQLAVMDAASNPGYVTMLFLGIDKDRAEAVYGDINTLDLRTARKAPTEGGAVSAHLLIDLTSPAGLSGNYAVLEDVEGLSRSRIVPYLRWLFDKFVSFVDTAADGQETNVSPQLSDEIVLDAPIAEQLNSAKLLAVDVLRKTRGSTIDQTVEFYEKTRLIEYRPVGSSTGSRATRMIRSILDSAPTEEYPEVRVRLQEPSGNERSLSIQRQKTDALMGAFQLRTLAKNITPPLPEASRLIATQLVSEMKKAISKRQPGKK